MIGVLKASLVFFLCWDKKKGGEQKGGLQKKKRVKKL